MFPVGDTDTVPRWRSLEDDSQCASSRTAAASPDFAGTSLVITHISLSCVSPSGVTRCLSQGGKLSRRRTTSQHSDENMRNDGESRCEWLC